MKMNNFLFCRFSSCYMELGENGGKSKAIGLLQCSWPAGEPPTSSTTIVRANT